MSTAAPGRAYPDGPLIFTRALLQWLAVGLWTMVISLIAAFLGIFRLRGMVFKLSQFWARVGTRLVGIRVEVSGTARVYRDGPVIAVVNHQGMADIPALLNAMPIQIHWMAKHTLFRIPILGWGMYGAGAIPVVRDDRRKAMESLFQAAEQIQAGKSVIVFPEGTRSHPDGSMLSFKKGSFVLAKKARVHLQPITVWGTHNVVPFTRKWIARIYPGTVRIVFHEPIPPELYADWSVEQLSAYTRRVIERPMERLAAFQATLG